VNGATYIGWIILSASLQDTRLNIAVIQDLAVNDYVEVRVVQDSGGALNVRVFSEYSPEFGMAKVLG